MFILVLHPAVSPVVLLLDLYLTPCWFRNGLLDTMVRTRAQNAREAEQAALALVPADNDSSSSSGGSQHADDHEPPLPDVPGEVLNGAPQDDSAAGPSGAPGSLTPSNPAGSQGDPQA